MNLIKDITMFWKETWLESKLTFFLEMVGTVFSMIAAIVLSTTVTPHLPTVFILYVIGSIALLYVSYIRRSSWMVFMFTFFTIMNFIGLFNHLMLIIR